MLNAMETSANDRIDHNNIHQEGEQVLHETNISYVDNNVAMAALDQIAKTNGARGKSATKPRNHDHQRCKGKMYSIVKQGIAKDIQQNNGTIND